MIVALQNGDEFMRRLEPIAATVPYMTSEGNHGQRSSHTLHSASFLLQSISASLSPNIVCVRFIFNFVLCNLC